MRDRALGSTVRMQFNSTNPDGGGAPVAPSSAFVVADIRIYKDGSATEKATTNGLTVTSPFDSITGLHLVEIDTSNSTGDSGFWASGSVYHVRLVTATTVATYSVSGLLIGEFSIELQTADVRKLLGTAWLTPGTAGTPDINVKLISGDSVAADNAEAFFDGTGYAGTNNVMPTVTTLTNLPTIPANWLTAAGIAADAITAAKIADGAIDTATFASGTTLPRVTLVDTTTTNTDMRGTDSAALAATALSTAVWTSTIAGRIDVAVSTRLAPLVAGRDISVAATTGAVVLDSATATQIDNIEATLTTLGSESTTVERSVSDTNAITFSWPVSGATITGTASLNNGAYGAAAGAIAFLRTETGRHYYTLAYNAADRPSAEGQVRYKFVDGTYTGYVVLRTVNLVTVAQVNAQVLDVLSVDTFGELGSPPAATSSLKDKLVWLFMWARNKATATSSQRKLFADDTTTVVSTETITDDGTTFTKGESL